MLPLIPTWLISILAFLAGGSCIWSAYRFRWMPSYFWTGLIILGPALIGFGVIYFYFTTYIVDLDIRQQSVRLMLAYLFGSVFIWQAVLNWNWRGK